MKKLKLSLKTLCFFSGFLLVGVTQSRLSFAMNSKIILNIEPKTDSNSFSNNSFQSHENKYVDNIFQTLEKIDVLQSKLFVTDTFFARLTDSVEFRLNAIEKATIIDVLKFIEQLKENFEQNLKFEPEFIKQNKSVPETLSNISKQIEYIRTTGSSWLSDSIEANLLHDLLARFIRVEYVLSSLVLKLTTPSKETIKYLENFKVYDDDDLKHLQAEFLNTPVEKRRFGYEKEISDFCSYLSFFERIYKSFVKNSDTDYFNFYDKNYGSIKKIVVYVNYFVDFLNRLKDPNDSIFSNLPERVKNYISSHKQNMIEALQDTIKMLCFDKNFTTNLIPADFYKYVFELDRKQQLKKFTSEGATKFLNTAILSLIKFLALVWPAYCISENGINAQDIEDLKVIFKGYDYYLSKRMDYFIFKVREDKFRYDKTVAFNFLNDWKTYFLEPLVLLFPLYYCSHFTVKDGKILKPDSEHMPNIYMPKISEDYKVLVKKFNSLVKVKYLQIQRSIESLCKEIEDFSNENSSLESKIRTVVKNMYESQLYLDNTFCRFFGKPVL